MHSWSTSVVRQTAITLIVSFGLIGCAKSNLAGSEAMLTYEEYGRVPSIRLTSPEHGVGTLTVTDGRADDQRTGTRVAERDNSTAEITISGDAEAWVRSGAEHVFGNAGIDLASGPLEMSLTLVELKLDENVFVNSGFKSRVTIEARLLRDGTELWKGTRVGDAGNHGRSGSQANYAETFNHALYKALEMILGDPGFRAGFKAE
jgi:hypothetical protein